MNALEKAIERFNDGLNAALNEAINAGVPVDHLILMCDLAHDDLLAMRQRALAQIKAQAAARSIVAAKTMPNGRQIQPPGS